MVRPLLLKCGCYTTKKYYKFGVSKNVLGWSKEQVWRHLFTIFWIPFGSAKISQVLHEELRDNVRCSKTKYRRILLTKGLSSAFFPSFGCFLALTVILIYKGIGSSHVLNLDRMRQSKSGSSIVTINDSNVLKDPYL